MPDIAPPPFESFAGGMFSGRVDSEYREAVQFTYMQCQSVDYGPGNVTGAVIGASMTSQNTGYQIQAAITNFTTVTPGVTGVGNTPTAAAVLPQTNRPFPFSGLLLYVSNVGANPINLYPHPNDAGNSINGQASNTPIVLGVNTITALQCLIPGVWQADGIGEGFNGSIATTVSQGNIATAGTNAATATPITQAIVNVTSGGAAPAGVTLPPAKAGTQIAVANNVAATTITVYPQGADTINGGASATVATASITLFICAVNGNWLTK